MINGFRKPQDLEGNPDIRVVGPPASGKTAFMGALARWPKADPNSPILSVDPFDDETGKLIAMARDILGNSLAPAGTAHVDDPNSLPLYTLFIEMKPGWFKNPIDKLTGRTIRFQVSCREYSGEFIEDLLGKSSYEVNLSNYIDDCASAQGLLLLIDGTSQMDAKYALALEKFRDLLRDRLDEKKRRLPSYRIAVVFSKCEQGQVWIHRYNIERFTELKFPSIKDTMEDWQKKWKCKINYFFCSAFGKKGSSNNPNVRIEERGREGTTAVIERPDLWQPFGLVAPIYWLHTGKDDNRLREI